MLPGHVEISRTERRIQTEGVPEEGVEEDP